MNRILYLLLAISMASCQNNKGDHHKNQLSDLENQIIQAFSDVDSLLNADGGAFWGKSLNGPVLLIDPKTRVFYSNENNTKNEFEVIAQIYRDTLPSEMNIANTAIDWQDKRWSMVMLPLPEKKINRNNLIIHELFHRIQPSIGYENIQELDNGHLDSYDGRMLLRLELQALEHALKSEDQAQQAVHLENALSFRVQRHTTPEIRKAENSLELNEGLAEYTAIMLSGRNKSQMVPHLIKSKNSFYDNPTFVRSFAYQTIPIYGYILSSIQPNWHRKIDVNSDLTAYFLDAFQVNIDQMKSKDEIIDEYDYGYPLILKEETEREKTRIEKVEKLSAKFTAEGILDLPFQNMNISFDARNLIPLEGLGTVYPNLRVTDNWGILTVTKDALLAPNWSKVTVSEPIEISNTMVKGDGWQLELKPEWKVEKANNQYQLKKQ